MVEVEVTGLMEEELELELLVGSALEVSAELETKSAD